ncbi:MAG: type II toxin-antitoxin system HicB family antitoxin, partial [Candidatus Sulfopaludibacter sp.]|nr:type II toxin-antitoxin system HicB family antitoxin [Candidatus Sulfopaludibacter sp.]
ERGGPTCVIAPRNAKSRWTIAATAQIHLRWKSRTASVPRPIDVIIERDAEGYYVASVPRIPGCHTQARSLDEINERIREAIQLCLEIEGAPDQDSGVRWLCIQRVTIAP